MARDQSANELATKLGQSYAAAAAKAPGPRTTGNNATAVDTSTAESYSVVHEPARPRPVNKSPGSNL